MMCWQLLHLLSDARLLGMKEKHTDRGFIRMATPHSSSESAAHDMASFELAVSESTREFSKNLSMHCPGEQGIM